MAQNPTTAKDINDVNNDNDNFSMPVTEGDYRTLKFLQQLINSFYDPSEAARIELGRHLDTNRIYCAAVVGLQHNDPIPSRVVLAGPLDGATREAALLSLLHEVEDKVAKRLDPLKDDVTEGKLTEDVETADAEGDHERVDEMDLDQIEGAGDEDELGGEESKRDGEDNEGDGGEAPKAPKTAATKGGRSTGIQTRDRSGGKQTNAQPVVEEDVLDDPSAPQPKGKKRKPKKQDNSSDSAAGKVETSKPARVLRSNQPKTQPRAKEDIEEGVDESPLSEMESDDLNINVVVPAKTPRKTSQRFAPKQSVPMMKRYGIWKEKTKNEEEEEEEVVEEEPSQGRSRSFKKKSRQT